MLKMWNGKCHNSLAISGAQKVLKFFWYNIFHEKTKIIIFKVLSVVLLMLVIKIKNEIPYKRYIKKIMNPPLPAILNPTPVLVLYPHF